MEKHIRIPVMKTCLLSDINLTGVRKLSLMADIRLLDLSVLAAMSILKSAPRSTRNSSKLDKEGIVKLLNVLTMVIKSVVIYL